MKSIFVLITSLVFIANANAASGPMCTDAEADTWMSEADFLNMAEKLGYRTEQFAVTEGNCYALTKMDGAEGELDYFNPVTGAIVQ